MAIYTVTGGAGFIGSHLVECLLTAGHTVNVVDNFSTGHRRNVPSGCAITFGDVTDLETMRSAIRGADGVFHLAAIASVVRGNEDWIGTHRVNQTGTITVLDAARAGGGVPVVYASSAAIYGDVGPAPARETDRPAPLTGYGADKLGSELHAQVAHLVHGVPTLGLRFFNVYGPRQDPRSPYSGVISIFADRIARRAPVTVHGDGYQTRDFVYVGDVVAHMVAAMRRLAADPSASVLNVCTGLGTSLSELIAVLGRVYGGPSPLAIHGPSRYGDIRHSVGDPTRAIQSLGLAASVTLEEGLAAMCAAPALPFRPAMAHG